MTPAMGPVWKGKTVNAWTGAAGVWADFLEGSDINHSSPRPRAKPCPTRPAVGCMGPFRRGGGGRRVSLGACHKQLRRQIGMVVLLVRFLGETHPHRPPAVLLDVQQVNPDAIRQDMEQLVKGVKKVPVTFPVMNLPFDLSEERLGL